MESYERNLSACEKTPRKQEFCNLSFLKTKQNKKTRMFLECDFMPLQGIPKKNEFASGYFLQLLLLFIYMLLWKNMFLPHVTCPCGCTFYLGDSS